MNTRVSTNTHVVYYASQHHLDANGVHPSVKDPLVIKAWICSIWMHLYMDGPLITSGGGGTFTLGRTQEGIHTLSMFRTTVKRDHHRVHIKYNLKLLTLSFSASFFSCSSLICLIKIIRYATFE